MKNIPPALRVGISVYIYKYIINVSDDSHIASLYTAALF